MEAIDFFARGLIKAPFKLAPLKDLPKIFELMGMSSFIQENDIVLMKNRARQDCRPLCTRNAGVGEWVVIRGA